jgi:hypothetical protein
LGDYFDRLRLHEAIFPETAYRLEGFTINAKNKQLTSVVSKMAFWNGEVDFMV